MAGSSIDPRARFSIELALTGTNASKPLLAKQEEAGRALGMTGAEMDVARRGSSFEFNTSIAVSLALDCLSRNAPARTRRRLFRENLRGNRTLALFFVRRPPEHELLLEASVSST